MSVVLYLENHLANVLEGKGWFDDDLKGEEFANSERSTDLRTRLLTLLEEP